MNSDNGSLENVDVSSFATKTKKGLSVLAILGIVAVAVVCLVSVFKGREDANAMNERVGAGFSKEEIAGMEKTVNAAKSINVDVFKLIAKLNAEGTIVPPSMAAAAFEADRSLDGAIRDYIDALHLQIRCIEDKSLTKDSISSEADAIRVRFRGHFYRASYIWYRIAIEAKRIAR